MAKEQSTDSGNVPQLAAVEFRAGEQDVNGIFSILAAAKLLHRLIKDHDKELRNIKELSVAFPKDVDMGAEDVKKGITNIKQGMKLFSWLTLGIFNRWNNASPADYIINKLKAKPSQGKDSTVQVVPEAVTLGYVGIPEAREKWFTPGVQLDPWTQGPDTFIFERFSKQRIPIPEPRWEIDKDAVEILPPDEMSMEECESMLGEFLNEHTRASQRR